MNRKSPSRTLARTVGIAAFAFTVMAFGPAHAVDWDGVDTHETQVFHPGQASWEWVLTPGDHSRRGVERFREEGRNCQYCHEEDVAEMGEGIAAGDGEAPEAEPFGDRPGWLDLDIQATHDGERMYWRFAWEAQDDVGDPMDPDHPARVTVMFAGDTVKEATRAGCWGSCHDDLRDMESDTGDLDLTKYIAASRTQIQRSGGGENYRDDDELAGLVDQGYFFEYWQARLTGDSEALPVDGYILERRHEHDEPAIEVEASRDGDLRVVTISRPLEADADTRHALESGGTYYGGFAVHEGGTEGRFHYVSLEYTFSIDSDDGDIAVTGQ